MATARNRSLLLAALLAGVSLTQAAYPFCKGAPGYSGCPLLPCRRRHGRSGLQRAWCSVNAGHSAIDLGSRRPPAHIPPAPALTLLAVVSCSTTATRPPG